MVKQLSLIFLSTILAVSASAATIDYGTYDVPDVVRDLMENKLDEHCWLTSAFSVSLYEQSEVRNPSSMQRTRHHRIILNSTEQRAPIIAEVGFLFEPNMPVRTTVTVTSDICN